jgi:molybdate transport system substrate-binding protein
MVPTSLKRAVLALAVAVASFAVPAASAGAAERPVTVFAAASMKDVLTKIGAAWKAETGREASFSFAASSALARQVGQGAPADIFISADRKWMDYLDKAGLIVPSSRRDLVGNRLVLIGAPDAPPVDLRQGTDLGKALGAEGRLAVGLTASVPAGVYARQALEHLKMWDAVKDRLAEAENVRAALILVARGEAPLGIVYETDARAQAGVKQLATFPEASHEPIVYPAALTTAATSDHAAAFLDYLGSPNAENIFEQAGFTMLKTQ